VIFSWKKKNRENYIIHENEREACAVEKDKVRVELLAPGRKDIKFEPMLLHFAIGGTTDVIFPKGVYVCLVLQGKLELTIKGELHILIKGDSIYLGSPVEHIWKNIGKTEIISIALGFPQMSV
jgi:quercetin dioxygenase-like cupin family protein